MHPPPGSRVSVLRLESLVPVFLPKVVESHPRRTTVGAEQKTLLMKKVADYIAKKQSELDSEHVGEVLSACMTCNSVGGSELC